MLNSILLSSRALIICFCKKLEKFLFSLILQVITLKKIQVVEENPSVLRG